MHTTRRALIGGAGAALAAAGLHASPLVAQEASPVAVSDATPAGMDGPPGYAIARVRRLPDATLNQANYPNVMATYLPRLEQVPGFMGYVFAFDDDDPDGSFSLTLLDDESSVAGVESVTTEYVASLDPRFAVETPWASQGAVRMFAATSRPLAELPPFLHGAPLLIRDQTSTPDFDLEAAVALATETLLPRFMEQPGFVLYCWFVREGGRVVVEIWETPEDLEASREMLLAWRDEHFSAPTSTDTTDIEGTIGYVTIAALG
jgi:hypothetical protein